MSASASLKFIFFKKTRVTSCYSFKFWPDLLQINYRHNSTTRHVLNVERQQKQEGKQRLSVHGDELCRSLRQNRYDVFHRENMPK